MVEHVGGLNTRSGGIQLAGCSSTGVVGAVEQVVVYREWWYMVEQLGRLLYIGNGAPCHVIKIRNLWVAVLLKVGR